MLIFSLMFGFTLVMQSMIYGLDYCIEFSNEHDETCEAASVGNTLKAHVKGAC